MPGGQYVPPDSTRQLLDAGLAAHRDARPSILDADVLRVQVLFLVMQQPLPELREGNAASPDHDQTIKAIG
eukprot:6313377-Alexandrium_andersonii.AAC.1